MPALQQRLSSFSPCRKQLRNLDLCFSRCSERDTVTASSGLTLHKWLPTNQRPQPFCWSQGLHCWDLAASLLALGAHPHQEVLQHQGHHFSRSIPLGCMNSIPPPPLWPGTQTCSGFHSPCPSKPASPRLGCHLSSTSGLLTGKAQVCSELKRSYLHRMASKRQLQQSLILFENQSSAPCAFGFSLWSSSHNPFISCSQAKLQAALKLMPKATGPEPLCH